jgi:hypothetical protein
MNHWPKQFKHRRLSTYHYIWDSTKDCYIANGLHFDKSYIVRNLDDFKRETQLIEAIQQEFWYDEIRDICDEV